MSSRRTLQDTNLPAATRSTKTNSINSRSSKTSTASIEFDPEREKKAIEAVRKERTKKKFNSRDEYLNYLSEFEKAREVRHEKDEREKEHFEVIQSGKAKVQGPTLSSSGSEHNKSHSSISSSDVNPHAADYENYWQRRHQRHILNEQKYGTTDPRYVNHIIKFGIEPIEIPQGEYARFDHPHLITRNNYYVQGTAGRPGGYVAPDPSTAGLKIPKLFATNAELNTHVRKIKSKDIMKAKGTTRLQKYLPNMNFQDEKLRHVKNKLPSTIRTSQYDDEPATGISRLQYDEYLQPKSRFPAANYPMESDSHAPIKARTFKKKSKPLPMTGTNSLPTSEYEQYYGKLKKPKPSYESGYHHISEKPTSENDFIRITTYSKSLDTEPSGFTSTSHVKKNNNKRTISTNQPAAKRKKK